MAKVKSGHLPKLEKSPTGIEGLDEITGGGLPKGRPTLVSGGAGCGKTLLAMEFIVRGALQYNEPGVFMAFEENAEDLAKNVSSLGFDLNRLAASKKVMIDYVHIDRSEIEETGEYDLEGLFIRLDHAVNSIGAKRVALDTVESLFSGLPNPLILRSELRRLFRWLKNKGLTSIITAERGENTLTRHNLEEYVSDCVLFLDHRVDREMSTRRLRVVKYRGSSHGTNEYPFLIGERGISVLPITSVSLDHDVSTQRISTGIPRLDTMLGGRGFYRGSTVLISGTAGVGKTSIVAQFVGAASRRGERCLYFAFEEPASQIVRNMNSIGIDLAEPVRKGTLKFVAARPTLVGLEGHLALMHKAIEEFKPSIIAVDPISSLTLLGDPLDVKAMLTRLVDYLKMYQITSVFTNLTAAGNTLEGTELGVSSLADTWILLRDIEIQGERNRGMYILKSRGMAHSNQIREFLLTGSGIDLQDVYVGPGGVLTGAARASQEAQEKAAEFSRQQDAESRRRQLENKRRMLEAQISALRGEMEDVREELQTNVARERVRERTRLEEQREMARKRKAD